MVDLLYKRSRYPFNYRGCKKEQLFAADRVKLMAVCKTAILRRDKPRIFLNGLLVLSRGRPSSVSVDTQYKTAPDKRLFQY
jgi:hypothetical protein